MRTGEVAVGISALVIGAGAYAGIKSTENESIYADQTKLAACEAKLPNQRLHEPKLPKSCEAFRLVFPMDKVLKTHYEPNDISISGEKHLDAKQTSEKVRFTVVPQEEFERYAAEAQATDETNKDRTLWGVLGGVAAGTVAFTFLSPLTRGPYQPEFTPVTGRRSDWT